MFVHSLASFVKRSLVDLIIWLNIWGLIINIEMDLNSGFRCEWWFFLMKKSLSYWFFIGFYVGLSPHSFYWNELSFFCQWSDVSLWIQYHSLVWNDYGPSTFYIYLLLLYLLLFFVLFLSFYMNTFWFEY